MPTYTQPTITQIFSPFLRLSISLTFSATSPWNVYITYICEIKPIAFTLEFTVIFINQKNHPLHFHLISYNHHTSQQGQEGGIILLHLETGFPYNVLSKQDASKSEEDSRRCKLGLSQANQNRPYKETELKNVLNVPNWHTGSREIGVGTHV